MFCNNDIDFSFLQKLRKSISSSMLASKSPEVAAFLYWSNAQRMKSRFIDSAVGCHNNKRVNIIARVFLVPPTNVPLIWLYLATLYKMMRIELKIRLSSQNASELDRVVRKVLIQDKLFQNDDFADYDRDDELTRKLSASADLRVVWGSDETVNKLSQFPVKPGGFTVNFPDRHSLAIIDQSTPDFAADDELFKSLRSVISGWEMSCSSPKSIFILSPKVDVDLAAFSKHINEQINPLKQEYPQMLARYSKRLLSGQLLALSDRVAEVCYSGNVGLYTTKGLNNLGPELYSLAAENISFANFKSKPELIKALPNVVQTVGVWPNDRVAKWGDLISRGDSTIFRVVPLSQMLTFDYIWEGVNLIDVASRHYKVA